jgi:hypothetical protein
VLSDNVYRNLRKSLRGSLAMGMPRDVVALNIFIRRVEGHNKKEN